MSAKIISLLNRSASSKSRIWPKNSYFGATLQRIATDTPAARVLTLVFALFITGFVVTVTQAAPMTSGAVTNDEGLCLENLETTAQTSYCSDSTKQIWTVQSGETIRNQDSCLDSAAQQADSSSTSVALNDCSDNETQKWKLLDGAIIHEMSQLCLAETNSDALNLQPCNGDVEQRWNVPSTNVTDETSPSAAETPANASAPASSPSPSSASPSGEAMPVGDLPGWKQIFADDFTKNAELGSWGSECDADKIVYTGAEGQQWKAYPKCFNDTYQKRPYRSDEVLSVQNGILNFWLHNVDGQPAGANPSPVINAETGEQNQTYGRYTARFKVDTPTLSEYYVAWLLWPQSEVWPEGGEEDFPEGSLAGNVGGFHHYAGSGACVGCQDVAKDIGATFTQWHTYTMEWTPDRIKYILDDQVVLDSTKHVPSEPMRWQLQTETNGNGTNSGNLMVDWVSVYSYQP